jgi:hypothetical protein
MWYAFGRASDLAFVRKCSLSLSCANVLFIQLIRTKTSEEQGLSLFPDESSFITCPLHAIGMALAMQDFPASSLIDLKQLATVEDEAPLSWSKSLEDLPISDVLLNCAESSSECSQEEPSPGSSQRRGSPARKIQGYVNAVVKATTAQQANADITSSLSSHSFRRGGAQHANGDPNLSAQWIFDRGSWNMTATNKAFAYVFNTTSEDMKVSKVLSGWKANDTLVIPSLEKFDASTKAKIRVLRNLVFASSLGFDVAAYNLNTHVADLLVATLIRHFSELNDRYPMSPYVSRMRTCLVSLSISLPEILSWSTALARRAIITESKATEPFSREMQLINHQNMVIAQLRDNNRELASRNTHLENQLSLLRSEGETTPMERDPVEQVVVSSAPATVKSKSRRSASKSAASSWFEWYTKTPRLLDVCEDRQYKSQSKQIVASMKLFLPQGYKLDPSATSYKNDVLREGNLAEANMFAFLRTQGVKRKLGSGLLKQLRQLHRANAFSKLEGEYRKLLDSGKIVDPAPSEAAS